MSATGVLLAAVAGALDRPPRPVAQGPVAIAGTVTSALDGLPLGGVTIRVEGTSLIATTGTQGSYRLARVPPGTQTLVFQLLGYATRRVTLDASASSTTLDVVLDASPVRLGEIVVEGASRGPERLLQAPAAVALVELPPARLATVTNQAPLAFASLPGVDVVQNGLNDFNINARGFNASLARSVLVLQDGRDLSVPLLGSQEWAAISFPLDETKVEFIRGPGSALYGANAFTGVVNIETPAARDLTGTRVTLAGGELSTMRADFRYATVLPSGKFGLRATGGYTRSASWSRSRTRLDRADFADEYAGATSSPVNPPPPGFELIPLAGQSRDQTTGQALGTPNDLQSLYGAGRLDYYAPRGSVGTLEGGVARADNEVFVTAIGRVQVLRSLRPWLRVAWDSPALDLSASYSGRRATKPQVQLASGLQIEDESAAYQVEGRYTRLLLAGGGRLIVGGSFRESQVDSKNTLMAPQDDQRTDRYYSGYAQLEYDRLPRIRLLGAVRWDQSDLFDAEFSPKGSVVFSLTADHAIRFGVNRAFLTPSQVEFFLQTTAGTQNLAPLEAGLRASPLGPALAGVPNGQLFTNSAAVPVIARGNPDLVPEKVTSYELGYKGQISNRFFATLDAYWSRVKDFVTTLLPAPVVNPAFQAWTAPAAVPDPYRATVESAVRAALAGTPAQLALTRLPDGTTAIVLSYGNAGVVHEWGVELGAWGSLTSELSLGASYTFFDFDVRQQLQGDVLLPNTPRHKGSGSVRYDGRQGFELGLDVRLVEAYQWASGVNQGPIPGSQIVNADASYQLHRNARLQLIATNLLDQRRYHIYGGSVIGRRMLGGLTVTF